MWALILLILLLVICNFGFVHSAGWARLGWQVFSFGGLFIIYKVAGLSLSDIGLSKSRLNSGVKYAIVSVAIISLVFLILFLFKQSIFRDPRYNQAFGAALTSALLYVPLKTVFFEELAFRGIMPPLLKNLGASLLITVILSALLFGLWHIASAPKGEILGKGDVSNLLVISMTLLATSLGGIVLYWLRYKSGSLVPAIAVHWFINALGIVLSSLSWLHHQ